MKNTYLIGALLVIVGVIAFVFWTKKTEAPVEENTSKNTLSSSTPIQLGSYKLNTETSKINWKGEKITGSSHDGIVMLSGGNLEINENGVSGSFDIDMTSIDSVPNIEMLVKHIKGDDFFAVDKFPKATFVIKSMTPSSLESEGQGRYLISGDLTIKDTTQPVSFIASVESNDTEISATGSFAINRTTWNIKYGSSTFFGDLGDKAIRDAITITIDLKGTKVIQ